MNWNRCEADMINLS